jgi:hypothetical protein
VAEEWQVLAVGTAIHLSVAIATTLCLPQPLHATSRKVIVGAGVTCKARLGLGGHRGGGSDLLGLARIRMPSWGAGVTC